MRSNNKKINGTLLATEGNASLSLLLLYYWYIVIIVKFLIHFIIISLLFHYYFNLLFTLFTFTQVFTFFLLQEQWELQWLPFFLQLQLPLLQFFSLQLQQSFFLETSVSFLFVFILAFFLPLLNIVAACLRVILSNLVGSISLPENAIIVIVIYF
jgi:hypothetical protein